MTMLEEEDVGDVKVVRLKGSLAKEGAEQVSSSVIAAATESPRLVIDLSGVDLLATPGITMLLAAQKTSQQAGGRMILTGTKGFVDELLRRCRLDAVLSIVPVPSEALRRAGEAVTK